MNDQPLIWGPSPAPPPPSGEELRFSYVERGGLLALTVVNFLLIIVTLGIYRFWAKTAVRKHIWSCVHINDEPLEYTGRGKELFLGAMIVLFLFFLPYIALQYALSLSLGPESPVVFALQLVFLVLFLLFYGLAIYRARKYQLSRTLWRGIRGALIGSSLKYSLLHFGALLLGWITFGWSQPAMSLELTKRMAGEMRFGETPFAFKGRAGPLYPTYALCWFLVVALFIAGAIFIGYEIYVWFTDDVRQWLEQEFSDNDGEPNTWLVVAIVAALLLVYALAAFIYSLVWAIYSARELALFASYTTFENARFRLDATAASLVWLALGNLLIMIFTLTIGNPFIQQRNVRYVVNRLSVVGTVDIDAIRQSQHNLSRTGEGLADAFDIGGL